jgi:hypothetical protein
MKKKMETWGVPLEVGIWVLEGEGHLRDAL